VEEGEGGALMAVVAAEARGIATLKFVVKIDPSKVQ
jgi:hypothetical protein